MKSLVVGFKTGVLSLRAITWMCLYLCTTAPVVLAQHIDVELPYTYSLPLGAMGDNIAPVHSFHLEVLYGLKNRRISFGLGFQMGRYDRYREDELIDIDNNTILAPVIVNHRFSTLMSSARYDLSEGGPLIPYLTLRLGWGFFSSYLQVRDPERTEGSEGSLNLYEDKLHRSNTLLGGLGAGARFDLAHIFDRIGREQLYFNGELSFFGGPEVDYSFSQRPASSRYSIDETGSGSEPYEIIQHSLHTTERYSTAIAMASIKVGILWRIDLSGKSEGPP